MPGFIDEAKSEDQARRLLALSELDVNRDLFEVMLMIKSDVNPSEVKYYIDITDWNESGIDL